MIVRNTDVVGCPYALGDVLVTSCPVSPAERWTGTVWQQIKDCFLLAAGDRHKAGSTGGEAEHVLTINEIPAHDHNLNGGFGEGGSSSGQWRTDGNRPLSNWGDTGTAGGGAAHNNMPPYKVYFMWERIK